MPKNKIVVGVLALIATIMIAAVAAGTIALLKQLDGQLTPVDNSKEERRKQETVVEEGFKENIDKQKSKAAEAVAKEATNLTESNPAEAHKKYLEAAEMYRDAGDMNKTGEMQANAMTAALLADRESQQ